LGHWVTRIESASERRLERSSTLGNSAIHSPIVALLSGSRSWQLVRHLSHLKMYLMMRIRERIFAITSSCMRLKHMAISAMPGTVRARCRSPRIVRGIERGVRNSISSAADIIALPRAARECHSEHSGALAGISARKICRTDRRLIETDSMRRSLRAQSRCRI
jgi:hypothetical protein